MQWISVPELAKVLGLDDIMIREHCEEGLLPAMRNPIALAQGRRAKWRINSKDIQPYLDKHLELSPQQVKQVLTALGIQLSMTA